MGGVAWWRSEVLGHIKVLLRVLVDGRLDPYPYRTPRQIPTDPTESDHCKHGGWLREGSEMSDGPLVDHRILKL